MSSESAITAVVIATSAELAKRIAGLVSKAGFSVKGKIATDQDVLEQELKMREWDVVLAADTLPSGMEMKQVVEIVNDHQSATPVFFVSQTPDESLRYKALEVGATDALSMQYPPLFHSLMERELTLRASLKAADTVSEELSISDAINPSNLSPEEQVWYERIQKALEHDHFVCAYQPIVNLKAEPYPIYELLLRMVDDEGHEISPGAFLGSAEKAGFMPAIDRWVIRQAIKSMGEKLKEDPRMRFFIKLSSSSILDESFGAWLSEQIYAAKLPESCLAFEFTEQDARDYRDACCALIKSLKLNHCMVVLDRLMGLDDYLDAIIMEGVDYVKISGELIRHLNKDEKSKKTIIQIASRARQKDVQIIAQSVQDASALAFLWQHGVGYMQGYYVQRPDAHLNYDFSQEESDDNSVVF